MYFWIQPNTPTGPARLVISLFETISRRPYNPGTKPFYSFNIHDN